MSGSEASAKRAKIRDDGSYSTSQGSGQGPEFDSSDNPEPRPMGIKAAKRKAKGKQAESSDTASTPSSTTASALEAQMAEMRVLNARLTEFGESYQLNSAYEILMKDTSNMTPEQLECHLVMCERLRQKYPEFARR